jgi:seryl-tRNA synthetase
MLDINLLRDNLKLVKDSEKKRGHDLKIVDGVLDLDKKWKTALKKVEQLKHKRNTVSLEINELKKKGKAITSKIKEMKSVVVEIKKGEEKANSLLKKRNDVLRLMIILSWG